MCRGSYSADVSVRSIKSCYWNIHGWTSKEIGNKLNESEFLEKISMCDIVGLSEIHCDKEVSLPGFVSLKQKIRKKNHKGPKISGGIGIFIKENFKNLIQTVSNKNQDSVWIKIKKELCDEKEDIYIGSFYFSPEGKKDDKKKTISLLYLTMKLPRSKRKALSLYKVI